MNNLPEYLERSLSLQKQWQHPQLLLSQCCGPDLFGAAGGLEPVARPIFDLACEPGTYFSHVVKVAYSHTSARRVVINSPSSRSGCAALLGWLEKRGWTPSKVVVSGSHAASAQMLRRGQADLAAIDAMSWKIIDTSRLEIVGKTSSAPAPPYIKRMGITVPKSVLFEALEVALSEAGEALGIKGVLPADLELYRPLALELADYADRKLIP